jgi:L-ribulose-5-phosphate 3-epimerase
MKHDIGFMQGRLCSKVNGKIQAFPWKEWELEFPRAEKMGLHLMEWTLDQERLYENPLMTDVGQKKILELCEKHQFKIRTLTGDCFMQAPFYKKSGPEKTELIQNFQDIVVACSRVGIEMIVIPLVDGGRLEDQLQENELIKILMSMSEFFKEKKMKIIFESDYSPLKQVAFLDKLSSDLFGMNYDSGNSAALGYDPDEEIAVLGARIFNVHIKDRILGGTTVPLGTGNANFLKVFDNLKKINYQGRFILQTARAIDEQHDVVLTEYKNKVTEWILRVGL